MNSTERIEKRRETKRSHTAALFNKATRTRLRKSSCTKMHTGKAPKPESQQVGHACTKKHPEHARALVRLKRIQGQIAGIENMIEERRYCVDILTQFRAVSSALKATQSEILEKHIRSCVQEAITSKDEHLIDSKVDELMRLFSW